MVWCVWSKVATDLRGTLERLALVNTFTSTVKATTIFGGGGSEVEDGLPHAIAVSMLRLLRSVPLGAPEDINDEVQ